MNFKTVLALLFLIDCGWTNSVYKEVGDEIEIIGAGTFNITFDGDRLKIRVSSLRPWGVQGFCVGPTTPGGKLPCSEGMGALKLMGHRHETTRFYEYDRNGYVRDGSTTELAPKLTTEVVTIHTFKPTTDLKTFLLNAKIYVPKEEGSAQNASLSPAIIVCIVIAVLIALIVIGAVMFCLWCQCKVNKNNVPSYDCATQNAQK